MAGGRSGTVQRAPRPLLPHLRRRLLGILNDYHRLQRVVETNDQELEQLRGLQYEVERLRNQLQSSEADCDKLRHEVGSYRGEAERHVKEREDIAASLTRSMNEALARLRGETL